MREDGEAVSNTARHLSFLRVGFSLNARGLKVLFVQGYFYKAAGNEKKCLLLQLLSYADTSNR